MIGQTISHYKILSKLGEGGMGEVWKAEDLNLERQVALKFLASHLIADPEIHKRFQREAKAAASLSHPNICYVHEIDEVDGRAFLAMELVEGEGLEDRIEQGPLPLNEALDLARQAAEGLQAAHDKGIVHRDIKPGNIRITADGRAKILDFGLALLTEGSKLTKLDTRVGTVAYMSPEQAQGAEVDHRSDIWALGCLLYEMVSGQRPFKGQYDQALLYEIVGEEPEPLTGLRTAVPVELEFIANKCLEKQAVNRYQTAREVMVDLRNLEEKLKSGKSTILRSGAAAAGVSGVNSLDQSVARSAVSVDPGPRGQHRERLAWLIAAALGVGMLALAFVHFGEKPPEAPLRRFTLTPPVGIAASDRLTDVAISPNGRHIAFTGAGPDGKLWVQDLDQRQPRAIERSEGAAGPFWSPDSEFIGFAAASELRKVSRQGGLATVLCQMASSDFFGGSWSPDGELIAFASASVPNISSVPNINRVSSLGGSISTLVSQDMSDTLGEGNARPHFLPAAAGSRVLLFTTGDSQERVLMVKDLDGGTLRELGPGAFPVYSSSGHLVYQAGRLTYDLWALPFSLDTLQATGEAFPISQNSRDPTVAGDQTLVYSNAPGAGLRQIVSLDREGQRLGPIGQAQEGIAYPSLSPDGLRVVAEGLEGASTNIWMHDVDRGLKTRLTFSPAGDLRPKWSPSGTEILFTSFRDGSADIFAKPSNGSGEAELLVGTEIGEWPSEWSADGKYMLYIVTTGSRNQDIRYLQRKEQGEGYESRPFLETPFFDGNPHLSPDGRFLAYSSDESGQREIYVRPFPAGDGKWQVSAAGGIHLRWNKNGREIFYVEGRTLMATPVSTEGGFSAGRPTPLFEHPALEDVTSTPYDVSSDGDSFILVEGVDDEDKPAVIHIVQNWYEEFRERN